MKTSEAVNTVKEEINIKKRPGFDLITGKVLLELSAKFLKLITCIFNAILQINYIPSI